MSFFYNIFVEWNRIQKDKRESLNYSFKDLKERTKIPIYRLKEFENGLSYPGKKEKAKLISALSISSDEYDEEKDLRYPCLFDKEEKTNKFIKIFSSKISLILSLIFSVIFLISFSFSVRECIPYSYNVPSFYDDKLIGVREEAIEKSTKVDSNYIFTTNINDAKIDYIFNENINYISQSKIDYKLKLDKYDFVYSFYSDPFDRRLSIEVENNETHDNFIYFYYLNYLDEDLLYDHEITGEDNTLESLELIIQIEALFPEIYENVDQNLKVNFLISLDNYLDYLKNGQYNCYSHESEFYYYSFLLFLGLIVSLGTLLTHFILKYKINKTDNEKIKTIENNTKEYKTLKKDISFEPFIKENGLIIFSQIFYFLTSINLYLIFANAFQVNNIHTIQHIEIIIDVLKVCMPLANILILFLNLNRKIINNKPLKTALSYLFIGIVFTSLECILIYDLSRSGDFFINIIISFFPKNLFFAMGLYALIYYFLFHKSDNLNRNKIKKTCFRLASVPLLAFLLFSLIYPQLTNAGILETNKYLNSFVASVDFSYTFIALGFIFIKKIVDAYFIHVYGEQNFSKYQRGNRYQFLMNILFILLILILFIVALSYSNNSDMTDVLGLENFVYTPCLIPILFFYKKRLDERNIVIDTTSSIAYLTSNIISYLLIFLTMAS